VTDSEFRSTTLWDTATGKPLRTFLAGGQAAANSVKLSGDGKLLAVGAADAWPALWDTAGNEKLPRLFKTRLGQDDRIDLSSDGKLLVTGFSRSDTILWDAATGQKLFNLDTRSVLGVALSGDAKRLLTGSAHGSAFLWETGTGKKLQTLKEDGKGVVALSLSGDGTYAATREQLTARWPCGKPPRAKSFCNCKGIPHPSRVPALTRMASTCGPHPWMAPPSFGARSPVRRFAPCSAWTAARTGW
jgi:hypothetical protein